MTRASFAALVPFVLPAAFLLASAAHLARADEAPVPVFASAQEPQAAVSPVGGVFVVAAKDGVISVTSSTDGTHFGVPVTIARVERLALGKRRGPRIAATARSIVVAAIGTDAGVEGSLLAWRSTDGGTTWQGPTRLNSEPHSAREGLHGLAAGPDGEVACVWLDDRSGPKQVFGAVSQDGGATWGKDALVYGSPDGHVCECCHPSVAWSASGELAVMFRNFVAGDRDLWVIESHDRGHTWANARKLGTGSWALNACPMDGGAIAARADGSFATVWRREHEVFLAPVGGPERSLGAGAQPWLAAGPGGVFTVWLERRGGDLLALAPGAKHPARLASRADDPAVASALDGKGPVVVVWASDGNVQATVLARGAR